VETLKKFKTTSKKKGKKDQGTFTPPDANLSTW
jgi:hypothetical protein